MPDQFDALRASVITQHRHLSAIILGVRTASGEIRKEAFDQFRQYLAAHEATEQQFVHGPAQGGFDECKGLAQTRVEEEDHIAGLIQHLEDLGGESAEFSALFDDLATYVDGHLQAEEYRELPELRRVADADQIEAAVRAFDRVAELAEAAIGDTCYADWLERLRDRVNSQ